MFPSGPRLQTDNLAEVIVCSTLEINLKEINYTTTEVYLLRSFLRNKERFSNDFDFRRGYNYIKKNNTGFISNYLL